jgi:hypothetical protein
VSRLLRQYPSNSRRARTAGGKRLSIGATASRTEAAGRLVHAPTLVPWCVPNKRGNAAVLRKLAHRVEQGVAACVVDTVSNLDPIRVELMAELEELECLLSPYCAGAQHGIDRDVVGP